MQGFYEQSNSMIWRDLVAPGYSRQYEDGTMDETESESDFESDESILSDYTDIDVSVILGRAIVIWTYTKLDSLLLFTSRRSDNLIQISKYAEINLDFDKKREKIMVMEPGEKSPKDVTEQFHLRPGSVVMVMPKYNVNVMVEINQLKSKFSMSADLMCTVYEVKSYIKKTKGIPIDQQDILYRDKAMENSKRLFEYKIRHGTNMYVLIQVHFDLLINLETFWGKTYRLYIDRCSTGSDLIYTVFGRTFSKYGQNQTSVHELFVPIHVLLLRHHQRSIHWNFCLGYFGIKNGDTLVLSTVGRHSNMEMQTMTVVTELGESHEVTVSKFDRWSVVAFILHGLTDVPVDLIRLFNNGNQIDFTSVIGNIPKHTAIIMNIMMNSIDKDISFGIPLKIGIGNGIVENVKMNPMRTVKDVKMRLEDMGVPNASLYELTTGKYKLPKYARLQDIIMDFKKPLFLKVEKFPVFVHAPDGIIYKTMVDVNNTLKDFKHKFELKTGHSMSTCRMLVAGQELRLPNTAFLYENGFSTRTSVFVETSSFTETFFITKGDVLIKLKLPIRPSADDIKRGIWATKSLPEGSITCLQTFFFWFFFPKVSRKYMLPKRKKNRKRLPIMDQPLPQMSDRMARRYGGTDDLSEIQLELHNNPHHMEALKIRSPRDVPTVMQKLTYPSKQYDPGFNRSNPKRMKIKNQHSRRDINLKTESEPSRLITHHITPRWMGNLQQKDVAHRLVPMTEDGLAYRQLSERSLNPFYMPQESLHSGRREHHQGDASTTRYFKKKPSYDHQELLYSNTSDTD